MIRLRPLAPDDIPMLAGWLKTPEVARWFDDPDYAEGIRGYLDDPRIRPRIVLEANRPVAYVHDYDIAGFDDHPLAALPPGARGLDTFIGETGDMQRGLGPLYLSLLTAELLGEGVPAVGIDPHPTHTAAIRAYEKAGFTRLGVTVTRWGPAMTMAVFAPETGV